MRDNIAIFCGGRGAASIARALLRNEKVALSLLVNGYDNGYSTGAIRRFLPGMLGPSDFRKNLTLHLDPTTPSDASILAVLTHRLPVKAEMMDFEKIVVEITNGRNRFSALSIPKRQLIVGYFDALQALFRERPTDLDLSDCALGNLLIAGAYLCHNRNFNAAIEACRQLVESPIRIVNVTNGENAYLVALKSDGTVIPDEANIVAPQNGVRITNLYLLADPLPDGKGTRWSVDEVQHILTKNRAAIAPSVEACTAIQEADLIVYGPGTPHSSLLPSYLTPGISSAIRKSRAQAKVFIANVQQDQDVRGLTPYDLFHLTLRYLGDPRNETGTITHVLHHQSKVNGFERTVLERTVWISRNLTRTHDSSMHNGAVSAGALMSILLGTREEAAM